MTACLSNSQFNGIKKYGESVIPLIGLAHWHITFKQKHKDDKDLTIADCNSLHNYKSAEITIFPKFFTMSEERQKICIIHELLHCHFAFWQKPYNLFYENNNSVPRETEYNCYKMIEHCEEESVELLARAIYKLLPPTK